MKEKKEGLFVFITSNKASYNFKDDSGTCYQRLSNSTIMQQQQQ